MAEVKVYTIPGCGFCESALRLLDGKNVAYVEIDVSTDAAALAEIHAIAVQRTFPQIVIDGVVIGGFTDLDALDRSGKLDSLLY